MAVECTASFDAAASSLRLSITTASAVGPVTFVLGVSAVCVEFVVARNRADEQESDAVEFER